MAPGAGLSVLAVRLSAAEALGGQALRTPTLLPVQAIMWLLWSRRPAGTELRLACRCEAFSKEPPACGSHGAGPAAVLPSPLCLRGSPWHRPCDRVSERHLRPAPSQWLTVTLRLAFEVMCSREAVNFNKMKLLCIFCEAFFLDSSQLAQRDGVRGRCRTDGHVRPPPGGRQHRRPPSCPSRPPPPPVPALLAVCVLWSAESVSLFFLRDEVFN